MIIWVLAGCNAKKSPTPMLNWSKLLNERRFSHSSPKETAVEKTAWLSESRTEIERDHDRILFSTPVRRLNDKTQVFPLEKNDSVRTRLTHSHEVSNLARSLGVALAYGDIGKRIATDLGGGSPAEERVRRNLPAMLAAIGLAHDLGNPPFGHQGETAICAWFNRNKDTIFAPVDFKSYGDSVAEQATEMSRCLNGSEELDFLKFEGNAQTIRVVTRLQVVHDDLGLNLTYGTLAALMKYTVGSANIDGRSKGSRKKNGFFSSERAIVDNIWRETGLKEGCRHPLTLLMEACDDIAYLILDAEDAVKKQIVSVSDLLAWLAAHSKSDTCEVSKYIFSKTKKDHDEHRGAKGLSPNELNDVSMQKFRVHAIHALVSVVGNEFSQKYNKIMEGEFDDSLLRTSPGADFVNALRDFDRQHAYGHRSVREIELTGFNVINGLMDHLWRGIIERKKFSDISTPERKTPFASYAYSRISENYRRIFEGRLTTRRKLEPMLPIRYRELQLLTDMISGMTDSFAIEMYEQLTAFHVGASKTNGA